MIYKNEEYDVKKYSTGLRLETGTKLNWDSAMGQSVLIVQFPYKEALDMEKICRRLNRYNDKIGNLFTDIGQNTFVRYITPMEKAKMSGCDLNGVGCSYLVLSCKQDGEEVVIYSPNPNNFRGSVCDVPLQVEVRVSSERQQITSGFFGIGRTYMDFYILSLRIADLHSYKDGELYYTVNIDGNREIKVPITKKMIEQGKVYIRQYKPEVKSIDNRIKVV